MPHRRSSSSATDSTASDDGWGWDDAPRRRGRRRSEDETASSSGSSGDSRRGKRRRRGNSAAYDTDSSSDGSSSEADEGEEYGARQHYHKRKKKRPPGMLLEYGIGGLLVLVVLGAAVAFMMSDSSSSEGATPSATGSQAIVTKDTTVQASGGTAEPSASASKPASSKAASSSPSPKPAAPASSKASPAAAPTDGGESAPAPAPAPSSDNRGPYKLVQDCSGENFFSDDCWTFWDADDPTHGSVNYLSKDDATKAGLISTFATSAIMVGLRRLLGVQSFVDPRILQRVDNTTELAAGAFRDSVRVHSTASVPLGSLIIADIVAMPYGCGTWPAWWMNGPDWPAGGELDILEGVSLQEINQISVHTSSSDCKRDETAKTTGTLVEANDDCNANNKGNTGCSYAEVASNSYGKSFNDAGGGVFATIFTKDAVSQYFWSRPDIPENIKSGSPDVSDWGIPSATWPSSTCDSKFWGEQTLIFDITLCGDWAGAAGVWSNGCSDVAPTCVEYVQQASPWTTAVFEVAYVRVYTM